MTENKLGKQRKKYYMMRYNKKSGIWSHKALKAEVGSLHFIDLWDNEGAYLYILMSPTGCDWRPDGAGKSDIRVGRL
jgi:hypothetical protein